MMKRVITLVLVLAIGAGCTTKTPTKKEETTFNPNGEILVENILTETILTEEVLH